MVQLLLEKFLNYFFKIPQCCTKKMENWMLLIMRYLILMNNLLKAKTSKSSLAKDFLVVSNQLLFWGDFLVPRQRLSTFLRKIFKKYKMFENKASDFCVSETNWKRNVLFRQFLRNKGKNFHICQTSSIM